MDVIGSPDGQKNLPRWFGVSWDVLQGLKEGTFDLGLPDGRVFRAGSSEPGVHARIDIANPDLFARVAREGDVGFTDAYIEGWWDTPDLQAVFDVLLTNKDWIARPNPLAYLVRYVQRIRHWMNSNTRRGSRSNISFHYDLGNEFYSLWLDESMTYSSALFGEDGEDLKLAQRRKYASICDRIGVSEGAHLLEIGCGWGGFAEFAAGERGARVTGLTISREQHDFAKKRLFEAGLAERCDIVMRDYREETGSYDGVASIEMFEAVGEKYWPVYFDVVRRALRPGANATIQVITIPDEMFPEYRKSPGFIQKHIFPGGMLPSPSALAENIRGAGLQKVSGLDFGQSYSRTLRCWHHAFNQAWEEIAPMGFDERFRRTWNLYLTSCAAGFRTGSTDVSQISMRHA